MTRRVLILACILIVVAVSLFYHKVVQLGVPVFPNVQSVVWTVEAKIRFESSRRLSEVEFAVPRDTENFEIVNETLLSAGYGLATMNEPDSRRILWTGKSERGEKEFIYRATLRRKASQSMSKSPERLEDITLSDERVGMLREYFQSLESSKKSPKELARSILRVTDGRATTEIEQKIAKWRKTTKGRLFVASQFLSLANIPARVAHGLKLDKPRRKASLKRWLEVHDGQQWVRFNHDGRRLKSLRHAFAWWYGRAPLTEADGGVVKDIEFSATVDEFHVLSKARTALASVHGRSWYLPLLYLSTDMQALFRIMLLIPFGALLICFIRNIIGVQTFGTFMLVLIALSFRDTQLLLGVSLFCLAISIGLLARLVLARFRLLMVPRLSAMLTIVVMLLLLGAVLMSEYEVEQGLSIALFPLVIMTMTIERMSIVWEEIGAQAALARGFGTLLTAVVVYLCMSPASVQYLFFVFPELTLVTLALVMLIGRYTGYRFTELLRFRELMRTAP